MHAKPVTTITLNPPVFRGRNAGPFAELHEQLTAEVYYPGVPLSLRLDARGTDQELCRRMRCPACRAGRAQGAAAPLVAAGTVAPLAGTRAAGRRF